MSSKVRIVQFALLLTWVLPSFAQSERSTDYGVIAGMDYSTEFRNDLELKVEEELRFENYRGAHLDRWLNEISFEGPMRMPGLGNRLHFGCLLGYVRHYDDKGYYDNRFRYGVDLSYRESVRRFKLAYRCRLMFTYRDERTGDYSINPKWYLRHKFQAVYQIPNSRYKYGLSTELFFRLREDSSEAFVDHVRTTLSVDYRLSRRQSISVAARVDNELHVKNPMDCYYLGITYHLKY